MKNLNIYTNEDDQEWIDLAKKVAEIKLWSVSKVIKYVMKKALIDGAFPLDGEAKVDYVKPKEPKEPEPKQEKQTPEQLFAELERKQEEKPKSNDPEEAIANCKERQTMDSGNFMCHFKNQYKPQYPYCISCWQRQDIWGVETLHRKD